MSKELNNIQDLKSAFISHCKELGCGENYIKVCENKFANIETALKDLEIIKELLQDLFEEIYFCDENSEILFNDENGLWKSITLPKEEYDLLKGWLE